MPVSSLLSAIRKPRLSNQKLFGLITFAILAIAALGASYYFYIQNNQSYLREYKLQTLDSYFEQVSKKLNNDFLRVHSLRNISESNSGENLPPVTIDPEKEKQILSKAGSTVLLKNDFDEFIIRVIYKEEPLKTSSSYSIPGNILLDSIYRTDPLNLGTVTNLDVMGEEYKLFARRYQYKDNVEIQMIGLIEGDHYKKLTRQLDPWIIALLATFLLVCLFGMPFLKMLFIAEDESLSRTDIIIAGFAVLIGSPLIFAVFLSMMSYLQDYYTTIPKQLYSIGSQIESKFEAENTEAVQRLKNLNLKPYDNQLSSNDSIQFFEAEGEDVQLRKNFKYISKIDSSGQTIYHINFIREPPIDSVPRNLAGRSYFKDYMASKGMWSTIQGVKYVMRPVVSIEDASEEAVYMMQDTTSDGGYYKVGSSQLSSVHNTVLPFGYEFAIIDEDGEVWFHSEPSKATLENFFILSRDNNDLKAAILGRVAATGRFDYHGQRKRYQSFPIAGTDLSVVAFYDVALLRLKISEALSITSIAIFWAFLFSALICLLTVILRNPRKGLYQYQDFLFDFLLPKKRNHKKYILLSVTFISFLLLMILITQIINFPPSSAFIASLLFIIWSYAMVYYSLHPDHHSRGFSFSIRDLFLFSAIVFLNLLLWNEGSQNIRLFLLAVFVQILCLVFFIKPFWKSKRRSIVKRISFLKKKLRFPYQYWYAIFLFSWLLISSVLPTFIFYTKAEKLEEMIWIKTSQFYMTRNFLEKEKDLKTNLPPINDKEEEFHALYRHHLLNGLYLNNKDRLYKAARGEDDLYEPNRFRQLLWSSRPIYNEKIRPYQAMVYKRAYDGSWQSAEKIGGINFQIPDLSEQDSVVFSEHFSDSLAERSIGNYSSFEEIQKYLSILTWVGCGIIISILFALILFYLDRFFGFRFRELKPNDFDTDRDYLLRFTDVLQRPDTNHGILLIGLPFSGKSRFAGEIVEKSEYNKFVTLSFLQLDKLKPDTSIEDCYKVLSVNWPDEKLSCRQWEDEIEVFILEHLEHDVKSFDSNRIKLRLICHLIAKKKRLILTSEIYPSQILAFYQDQLEIQESKNAELTSDFFSWRNILSAFPQVLIGITDAKDKVLKKLNSDLSSNTKDWRVKRLIAQELGYSNFLPTLAPVIFAKTKFLNPDSHIDYQRMIVHIQNLSYGYYTDIWNSMPSRERYMVYDLAKDGFLNIKNGNSLFTLMKKGLIIWRDRPVIFNNSFRNFIISSVSSSEALHLEIKNRGQGSWGTIRIVIYLVIFTIIVFILLGEPDLIKDFETLIGALGGIGVLIPVISSVLAKSGQK
ncbi:hypothetical protein LB467_03175 [Salegentibacter sp. JZCK2]|uniref:hypothetical protein n=1 Tax=Salegentibacter tibetensis TaxID=2873600 RepID=UPI001CCCE26C|nr:hypothetical protein [Salegentibacter tibetensis]MBZ9728677.1 hypothetical protein [Salegentibacter tibetensis]